MGPVMKLLKRCSLTFAGLVAPKRAILSDLQCNVESEFDKAGRGGS